MKSATKHICIHYTFCEAYVTIDFLFFRASQFNSTCNAMCSCFSEAPFGGFARGVSPSLFVRFLSSQRVPSVDCQRNGIWPHLFSTVLPTVKKHSRSLNSKVWSKVLSSRFFTCKLPSKRQRACSSCLLSCEH